jgi:S-formylglutathione hydrolase FrmB
MKQILLALVFFHFANTAIAGGTDTVAIYSPSMHKNINCVVIKPHSYKKKKNHFPVLYLLHGYTGSYNNWIIRVPELKALANEHQMLIVCPDGNYGSWYLDSPIDTSFRYETHISQEVVQYIDRHYRSIARREARAITGLSMGGHGALFLALRHAEVFGACGSMSGGVDLMASVNKFDISKRIGDTAQYRNNWKQYSVLHLVEKYPKDSLQMIIDCGTEDFYYVPNHVLHLKMVRLKIPHDYIERPGAHNWAYWKNAIQYQMLFFRKYFDRLKKVQF